MAVRKYVVRSCSIGVVACMATFIGRANPQAGPQEDAAIEQLSALKAEGEVIYGRECAPCHGADGQGDGGPALAGDAKLGDKALVIRRILGGTGDGGMDPFAASLSDRQIAAVATFIRNVWENDKGLIVAADVKPLRDEYQKAQDANKK
jgi:mono/diheme cytochrome c family protein